jgi:Reverse transcriptase (RNA-dependent DNA polymerase)
VRGTPLKLFANYLCNRKQFVTQLGINSNACVVTCGVPQGSTLGPLLFLLYVNDIDSCSSLLKFLLFADDTNILYCHRDLNTLLKTLNIELQKLSIWFQANKLSLNIQKSNYMAFGKKHIPDNMSCLCINMMPLAKVASTKFLGVIIDSNLNWNLHIKMVSSKLASGVGILYKCKRLMPRAALLSIYYSLVYSHLYYCCILWGNASKSVLKPLQTLQNKALRNIFNLPFRCSATPLYKSLSLIKLYDLANYQQSLFIHQFLAKNVPFALNSFFQFCPSKGINTRSSAIFLVPYARSEFLGKNITVSGPKYWNGLPSALQSTRSYPTFKKGLQKFIVSAY